MTFNLKKTYIWELLLILLVAFGVTRHIELFGREAEWQINSGRMAAQSLRQEGHIALWNPWLEYGHPLIDNPQSFVLNPFSVGPFLLFDDGFAVGVFVTALLAGLGGWTLGYTLGLKLPARLLLALLLIGKGNMVAMMAVGYYQLASAQAYFPWIVAGVLGLRRERAQPYVVGLALALTLQFWGGSIWYSLPSLVMVLLLAMATLNWRMWRRLLLAGLLTVGLSAISLLPIWLQRDFIGDHPPDLSAGAAVPIMEVLTTFVSASIEPYQNGQAIGEAHFYYSFVTPFWFLLLILGASVVVRRVQHAHVWRVGIVMIISCVLWGAGENFRWLYENVDLLAQWRFVGRALAVASFWIAVLLALSVDQLWRRARQLQFPFGRYVVAGGLMVTSAFAAYEVTATWHAPWSQIPTNQYIDDPDEACVTWLREQHPNADLSVWRMGYEAILTFIGNDVRLANIEADFEPIPRDATLSHRNIVQTPPRYALAFDQADRDQLFGYEPMQGSPSTWDGSPCLYERTHALDYVYGVSMRSLAGRVNPLTLAETFPLPIVRRYADTIVAGIWRDPQVEQVVVVSEWAYPGWQVEINGREANLESVGGLLGVIIPAGTREPQVIEFAYRPPLVYGGGVLTLITAAFCVVYLLWR